MTIVNRYIQRSIITATILVILVLMGIESFLEFIGQLSDIGNGNYGFLQALIYVPMQLPADLYQLFPMAGFLGSLIGLGKLASSSELIVMRASGVSIVEIAWSVIKAALLMIVFVTLIGELIAPILQNKANLMKSLALGNSGNKHSYTTYLHSKRDGLWLHHNNSFVHIGAGVNGTAKRVVVYHFNSNHRLKAITYAKKAVLQKGTWYLHDATKTSFSPLQIQKQTIPKAPFHIKFKPQLLQPVNLVSQNVPLFKLYHDIKYRRAAGLVTSQYELAFWQNILQPINSIIMICLGIPFVFGSLRSSSMGLRVLTGVIIGFAFYMLNRFFGPITLVFQFPPALTAIAPSVIFLAIYGILLRRIRI